MESLEHSKNNDRKRKKSKKSWFSNIHRNIFKKNIKENDVSSRTNSNDALKKDTGKNCLNSPTMESLKNKTKKSLKISLPMNVTDNTNKIKICDTDKNSILCNLAMQKIDMKKNVEKVTPKSFDTPNLKLPIPPKYGNPKSCEGSSVNIRDVAKVEKISKSNNLTGMSKSPTHVVSKDRPLTFKPNQLFLKDSYKPEGIKISDVSIDKKKNSLNGSRQKFIKLEEGICEQQPTHIHAGFVQQRTLDFEKRISEINKSERPLLNDSKPTNKKLPNSIIKKTHNCSSSQNSGIISKNVFINDVSSSNSLLQNGNSIKNGRFIQQKKRIPMYSTYNNISRYNGYNQAIMSNKKCFYLQHYGGDFLIDDEIMDQPDLTVCSKANKSKDVISTDGGESVSESLSSHNIQMKNNKDTYEHNRRPTSSQNNNDVPKTNNENGVYHMHKSISKSWNSRNNSQTETETVKFNCEKKRKDLSNYEYSNVTHPNDQKNPSAYQGWDNLENETENILSCTTLDNYKMNNNNHNNIQVLNDSVDALRSRIYLLEEQNKEKDETIKLLRRQLENKAISGSVYSRKNNTIK
uniref:Uncharacterized protein n=1 Tax=Lepeophtheirus salmonis TaxID=72036 RepID=A0A0K2SWZ4_LEPSM